MFKIRSLSIAVKIPLLLAAALVTLSLAIGGANYLAASDALHESRRDMLQAVVASRTAQLGDYLSSIEQDLRFMAGNPSIIEAAQLFTAAYAKLDSPVTYLQKHYITDNPHPTGEKEKLDKAADGSAYSDLHAERHPWIRQFLQERGYYDIFLFDTDGNLVYTVFKELDYATNLNTGEWKDTDLGNAFRAALAKGPAGGHSFFDFQPYGPSHGAPASFISAPLVENGKTVGVLVFQMPIDRMRAIMDSAVGLGETGETILVGRDGLQRNDSRFTEENDILTKKISVPEIASAFEGKTVVFEGEGWNGARAEMAAMPLDFTGVRWIVAAGVDTEEAYASIAEMRNSSLVIALVTLALVLGVSILFTRSITARIASTTGAMRALADGDLSIAVPDAGRKDELGAMADALQIFKDNAGERQRLEEQQQADQAERERRAALIAEQIQAFDGSVGEIITAFGEAATGLEGSAKSMIGSADEANRQSSTVAAAAEEASVNVQTVAAATEELSSSIREIGRQVQNSATIAGRAASASQQADEHVGTLGEAAAEISKVVDLIQDIAEKTNLLALNATIEAARSGEAGKGFAVVANEVKSLASQTAQATDDIARQIGAIQGATETTVSAMRDIQSVVNEVNEISSTIAAAVEEQSASTEEISRSIQEVANATQHVTETISGVHQVAGETGAAAQQVSAASSDLGGKSEKLRTTIDGFLSQVRAA